MPGQAIVTIKDKQWHCSVASTPAELAAGLSGVPSMTHGTGMLFILGYEKIVTVTAEAMLFPLSVIFISDNRQVTEVALLLAPGDYGTTGLPCRYFLEVNAGEANDIAPGEPVSIELTAAPTVPTTEWMLPLVSLTGVVMVGTLMTKIGKTIADAVEFRKQPHRYPERPKVAPVASERVVSGQPAAILNESRPGQKTKPELEFLPDSPEFLAYTIDDIGYRDKLDTAFQRAIARARER